MAMHWLLRLCYASVATLYSIFGLLEFGYALPLYATTAGNSKIGYLKFYLALRFIMAVIQIPAHASVLLVARYFAEPAQMLTTRLVSPPDMQQGKERYYKLISWCNVGLAGFIILGVAALAVAGSSAWTTFQALEAMSVLLLACVLLVRAVGMCTANTRTWFYLAWPAGATNEAKRADQTLTIETLPSPKE